MVHSVYTSKQSDTIATDHVDAADDEQMLVRHKVPAALVPADD